MRYRSYNSELLICTTLMVNVFNDIIIDRRKHGLDRDWSQIITLSDIVQQKIEVPCILGDRGIIMKSLENEPGRYKMPLIVLQMKGVRTDPNRMFDLHSDIFYQQDDSFSQLDYDNPMFRPMELSKKRGQPINISYDATFVTKYREDLDQILSNFAVHFRPDIYLKWWHPRRRERPLESQLIWDHSFNVDSSVDYNPQNTFMYKGTTTFTLKSWLFYGMNATDNAIDPSLEPIIEKVKIFGGDGDGNGTGFPDEDIWAFGNVLNTPSGIQPYENQKEGFGFYNVDPDQEFVGTDPEQMQNGQYAVNNVYAEDYAPISGDPVFTQIKKNPNAGDIYTTNERFGNYTKNQYQVYLEMDHLRKKNTASFKHVFFKGGFNEKDFYEAAPSGDFLFRKFFKTYINTEKAGVVFGDTYNQDCVLNLDYNLDTKNLTIWSKFEDFTVSMSGRAVYNSESGFVQEAFFESKPIANRPADERIGFSFHKEYDKNFRHLDENDEVVKNNIRTIDEYAAVYTTKLLIEDTETQNKLVKIRNTIKEFWDVIDLQETETGKYKLAIEDPKYADALARRSIANIDFMKLDVVAQVAKDDYIYQVLCNKYVYIVLKIEAKNESNVDIYDFGVVCPLKYFTQHALLYEVTIPESRELLGMNLLLTL